MRVEGAALAGCVSSPGVRRSFRRGFGLPIVQGSDRWPDATHFDSAALERPERAAPHVHVHVAEHLPPDESADTLPKHPGAEY